jgi:hypothetical protein
MDQIRDMIFAIQSLRPGSEFALQDVDTILWHDIKTSKPTNEELSEALNKIRQKKPMEALRLERNKLLLRYDYIITRAYSRNEQVPLEWQTYLQALRDLPYVSKPTLDANGNLDIASVIWPVKPEA